VSGSPASRVTLARIVRPHGRRGEVAAEILTDFAERLTTLRKALLWDERRDSLREAAVRGCWISRSRGRQAIFHFENSDSISDAQKLTGLEVQVPLAERVALPVDSYYVTDLIGCEVFDVSGDSSAGIGVRAEPRKIGAVRGVQFTGEEVAGTPILMIDSAQGELLIPLAVEICKRVDVAARRIEIAPPAGLLDLNSAK